MNFENCKIYKGKKLIGILPCKLINKTNLCDEHLLIRKTYNIKPGYILVLNDVEKFYVKDIRASQHDKCHIEVYFETDAQHKENLLSKRKVNLSLSIAFLSLVVSIVALVKSFITK